ncbi:replication initiator [Streptomyces sp. BHT-5-2]|uniref:replication initiator n=1 Tax=Streptomyces sp. BHT-5-2 TaxID=2866715 RepID=UPI0028C3E325|nr:replication initiator [Streptomyces sp. BHT-5-2]
MRGRARAEARGLRDQQVKKDRDGNTLDLPEPEPLRLRAWAHTLGYRGHILTKSRAYSTTYTALRAERAEYQSVAVGAEPGDAPDVLTDACRRYVGSGHTPGAALIAAGIAEDLRQTRQFYAAARRGEGEWSP